MKNNKLSMAIALFGLLILTFFSCEKKEDNPPYVGTWVNIRTMDIFEIGTPLPFRITMILSKSTMEMTFAVEFDNQFEDLSSIKGNLTVSEEEFIFTPTSIGFTNFDGVMEWVNKDEPGWEEELAESGWDETMTTEYQLEGDTLTMPMNDDAPLDFTRQ